MFWEAGDSDVEVVAIVFLNVSNEVDPVNEATFNRLPDVFPNGRVPSKS